MSPENRKALFAIVEVFMLHQVDSVVNEGRYMQALNVLDSLLVYWKQLTDQEPSTGMFVRKGNILMTLEDWKPLVATCSECINAHKESFSNAEGGLIYTMKGHGHRNLEEYMKAINSYESALSYYTKDGEAQSIADMYCTMALCYDRLSKKTISRTLYEKGFAKFLEYFCISREQLLFGELNVVESYKRSVLGLFGAHLYNMAVFEQEAGDKIATKEYLKMSANCGLNSAKSEYKRLYGQ